MRSLNLSIASGKGGTGKTLIATNLFYTLSEKGLSTELIDCDTEEPNALIFFQAESNGDFDVIQLKPEINKTKCIYCGDCVSWCNFNAILFLPDYREIKVLQEFCHGCGACAMACK